MWIRTQNGQRLINAEHFAVTTLEGDMFAYEKSGENYSIGGYSTHEKALKVLDMIQGHLETLLTLNCEPMNKYKTIRLDNFNMVFQMPQDSEVE